MKKVLSILFIVAIVGASFTGINASASVDEMPRLTKISSFTVPFDPAD